MIGAQLVLAMFVVFFGAALVRQLISPKAQEMWFSEVLLAIAIAALIGLMIGISQNKYLTFKAVSLASLQS